MKMNFIFIINTIRPMSNVIGWGIPKTGESAPLSLRGVGVLSGLAEQRLRPEA
jgi:hypothetical protein